MSRRAGRGSGWRPLLRIARRDALRARGRSALVVAMVGLPILAMTATDVLARSAQPEPDEVAARRLGTTQALLESANGNPMLQAPDPRQGALEVTSSESASRRPYADARSLSSVAPAGYRLLTSESGEVLARTRVGSAHVEWSETPVGDPVLAGRYVLRSGAAPSGPDQVAVTSAMSRQLGVPLGGTVRLTEPARRLTLTGIVDEVGNPAGKVVWAEPGALLGRGTPATGAPMVWLAGDRPVTWTEVQALNQLGLLVSSRRVLLDPPPDSAVPYYVAGNRMGVQNKYWLLWMLVAVAAALAALEVCLLAGAAFAVGARRQARALGLLAAVGGSRRHVRSVVLAGGLVLGTAGAVGGVVLGLALAAVARPLLTRVADADFGRFDVRPVELLGLALLGVATGVLAAVLPARTAARQDPVVALTGRRGQLRTARKVPAIGMVVVAVGIGSAALGSALSVAHNTGLNPLNGGSTAAVAGLIAGGAALAQIGLIIVSPAIIGLAGRWAGRLPLATRLALRDAARHRGRSAPAMAAVLTAVTGSTALLLYVASLDAHDQEAYRPSWPTLSAGVDLMTYRYDQRTGQETRHQADPDRVRTAISPALPPFTAHVVEVVDSSCRSDTSVCTPAYALPVIPPENDCFVNALDRPPTSAEKDRAELDPSCTGEGLTVTGGFLGTPVGGADTVRVVTRRRASAAAARALADGGVVVFQKNALRSDGTVLFDVVSAEEATAAQREDREPQATQVALPGAYEPVTEAASDAVYSPAAAHALGLRTTPSTLFLRFRALPTSDDEQRAQQALTDAGVTAYLSVERGYVSQYGLGLLALVVGAAIITLGSAGIATGPAQADARADQATLAAIGAAPRLRRRLAAAQALSISVLGTALGVAAGFVPGAALIGAVPGVDLVVPVWRLAEVLVLVPLLAAGAAWLLTRSRLPLERRIG